MDFIAEVFFAWCEREGETLIVDITRKVPRCPLT